MNKLQIFKLSAMTIAGTFLCFSYPYHNNRLIFIPGFILLFASYLYYNHIRTKPVTGESSRVGSDSSTFSNPAQLNSEENNEKPI